MENNTSGKYANQFSAGRRNFIAFTVAGIAVTTFTASPFNLFLTHSSKIKTIVFDAFAIFDPRSVFTLAESMFSERGSALNKVWRTKQFEYSWLRTAASQYKNFWEVTEDALIYAAKENEVVLSEQNKEELMQQYLKLNAWEDVLPVLETLKHQRIRLSFLSNMTTGMLNSCIHHSKLENYFEDVISTDNVRTYKPNPIAYQLGIDNLKLKREEILFVAFAGWDAAGSKWFGYPTFWLNRLSAPTEELNAIPDVISKDMNDLVNFLKQ